MRAPHFVFFVAMAAASAIACSARSDQAGGEVGGASGNGGKAGSTGGSAGSVGSDSGDACGCVAQPIAWGHDGGLVAYVDRSSLSPCRTFRHERDPVGTEAPTLTCSQELSDCTSSVSAREINVALEQPEVEAALAAAPVLFGRDTRPVDGTVFRITVGTSTIEIGEWCMGQSGCKEIPPTVNALGVRLRALTSQELRRASCRDVVGVGRP